MGPPKDYPEDRRQPKDSSMFQRVLDSLVVAAILGTVALGSSWYTRSVDNSYKIDRAELDIKRIEKTQEDSNTIIFDKFKDNEDRFRKIEMEVYRGKK